MTAQELDLTKITPAPEVQQPLVERFEERRSEQKRPDEPEDWELFTILDGWGRVPADKKDWLDEYPKIGGVVKDVPYTKIREIKRKNPRLFRYIKVVPNDYTEADYARVTGLSPMEPGRLAAFINSSDPDAIFNALGPESAERIIAHFQKRLEESRPPKRK